MAADAGTLSGLHVGDPLDLHARRIAAELDASRIHERLGEAARELTGAAVAVVEVDDADGEDARESPEEPGAVSRATILVCGETYGHLRVQAHAGGRLAEGAEEVVAALAGWAGIALANAQRHAAEVERRQALEETARRYDAMTEIARAVGGVPGLDRVLAVVAARTRTLVNARSAVMVLVEGEELIVSAASGTQAEPLVGERYPRRGTLAGAALERRGAVHLHEMPGGVARGLVLERLAPHGALAYPLIFRGRALGVLTVLDRQSAGPAFSTDDALVLEGIANSAAAGVATAQGAAAHTLRRSIAAAERERQRWARELHDQTLQDLAGLRLMMDALPEIRDPEQSSALLARASERVSEAIVQLRHLVAELRPLVLDDLGIEPALHALAERTGALTTAKVTVDIDLAYDSGRAPRRLAPEVEETIYRVVQESLSNSLKHADAHCIEVSVRERGGSVGIEVTDDGRGLAAGPLDQGFGLVGMRERLELVSGTLEVTGGPRRGTTVKAVIPVFRARAPSGAADPRARGPRRG